MLQQQVYALLKAFALKGPLKKYLFTFVFRHGLAFDKIQVMFTSISPTIC